MKFETYNTPDTRSEFEHRFHILSHLIKTDRFHVSPRARRIHGRDHACTQSPKW